MTTPHPYVPTGPVEATLHLGYCPHDLTTIKAPQLPEIWDRT